MIGMVPARGGRGPESFRAPGRERLLAVRGNGMFEDAAVADLNKRLASDDFGMNHERGDSQALSRGVTHLRECVVFGPAAANVNIVKITTLPDYDRRAVVVTITGGGGMPPSQSNPRQGTKVAPSAGRLHGRVLAGEMEGYWRLHQLSRHMLLARPRAEAPRGDVVRHRTRGDSAPHWFTRIRKVWTVAPRANEQWVPGSCVG